MPIHHKQGKNYEHSSLASTVKKKNARPRAARCIRLTEDTRKETSSASAPHPHPHSRAHTFVQPRERLRFNPHSHPPSVPGYNQPSAPSHWHLTLLFIPVHQADSVVEHLIRRYKCAVFPHKKWTRTRTEALQQNKQSFDNFRISNIFSTTI